MKWFKHFSDAHQHPKIERLIKEFGSDGYCVCFVTFEIISKYGNELRLSLKKYSFQDFNVLAKLGKERTEKVWQRMIEYGLLDGKAYKRGYLYSPKLRGYADEYTQRGRDKSRHAPDSIGTTPPIEVEVEVEVDKKKNRIDKREIVKKEMKFDYPSFQEANNPAFKDFLKEAYPGVHVEFEFRRMETWLVTNPKQKYKNYGKFCRGWIDRAGKGPQKQLPEITYEHIPVEMSEEEKKKAQADIAKMAKELAEKKKL